MKTKSKTLTRILWSSAFSSLLLVAVAAALDQKFDERVFEMRLTAKDWQDWAKGRKKSLLVEKAPLRVFTPEDSSTNFDYEIHVGSRLFPGFTAEGRTNELKRAAIDLGVSDAIAVLRKETTNVSYMLMLFSSDENGKLFSQFDLNIDGVWDVRHMATSDETYIFFEKEWLKVDQISDRNGERPIALRRGTRFEFKKSWQVVRQ